MKSDDTTKTRLTLLSRTADWRDHDAWREFVERYEPYIRRWCRDYRFDDDMAKEVSQDFWLELAETMRTFRYDSRRRFRGWLRTRFHWHAVDVLRERSREETVIRSLDDPAWFDVGGLPLPPEPLDDDDDPTTRRLLLLDLVEQVQAAVREKVQARTWQAFWHVSIDGWTTRETADALNMTYLAAYAAHKRVADRLAEEGERRLAELMGSITNPRPV